MFKLLLFCLKLVLIPVLTAGLFVLLRTFYKAAGLGDENFITGLIWDPYFMAATAGLGLRILLDALRRSFGLSNPLDFLDTLERKNE